MAGVSVLRMVGGLAMLPAASSLRKVVVLARDTELILRTLKMKWTGAPRAHAYIR